MNANTKTCRSHQIATLVSSFCSNINEELTNIKNIYILREKYIIHLKMSGKNWNSVSYKHLLREKIRQK